LQTVEQSQVIDDLDNAPHQGGLFRKSETVTTAHGEPGKVVDQGGDWYPVENAAAEPVGDYAESRPPWP
jgi:hypothetical protein